MDRRLHAATAIRYGLIGLALIAVTTIIEMSLHGLDVESWGAISGSALVLVPAWAGLLIFTRYRRDRQIEFLLLAIGAWGWAFGQLLWIVQITLSGSETWPSFADIGYLVWPVCAITAVVVHTRPFERSTRLVFMVDALVLAVALSFIAWELIIRPGVGDPARVLVAGPVGDADLSAHRHRLGLDARTVAVDQPFSGAHRTCSPVRCC